MRTIKLGLAAAGCAFSLVMTLPVSAGPAVSQIAMTTNMVRSLTQKQQAHQAAFVLAANATTPGDGFPLTAAPAAGSGPVGGGLIPAAFGAPQTDGYGTRLGYCAWDNGPVTNTTGYIAGTNSVSAATLAVVTAGADNVFQTTCAQIALGQAAAGDDFYVSYTAGQILAGINGTTAIGNSVATLADLNALSAGIPNGQVRLVTASNLLYRFNGTSWVQITDGAQWLSANGTGDIWHTTGNVGIGTSTPVRSLSVSSTAVPVSLQSSGTRNGIDLLDSSGTVVNAFFGYEPLGNVARIDVPTAGGSISLTTAGGGIVIDSAGVLRAPQGAVVGPLTAASLNTPLIQTAGPLQINAASVAIAAPVSVGSTLDVSGVLTANGGIATTSINASGTISAANVLAGTGTYSGLLTANGGLVASGATFTGPVSAGLITASQIVVNGNLSASTAQFTGAVTTGPLVASSVTAGTGTFSGVINANGGINTTSITASGNITAATATVTGSLSAGDANITNNLNVGGVLSAASGSITGTLNVGSLVSQGNISGVNGVFSGALTSASVNTGSVTASGAVSAQTLQVTGVSNLANVNVSGIQSSGSLVFNGAPTVPQIQTSGGNFLQLSAPANPGIFTPTNTISLNTNGSLAIPGLIYGASNLSGAGYRTALIAGTGTGMANATGGNGYVEIVGGGGTSTWTNFTLRPRWLWRGGINLQAGLAAADAGATYFNGSKIELNGSNGTSSANGKGNGSTISLTAGSGPNSLGTLNTGSSIGLGGATPGNGGNVSITSGSSNDPAAKSGTISLNAGSGIDQSNNSLLGAAVILTGGGVGQVASASLSGGSFGGVNFGGAISVVGGGNDGSGSVNITGGQSASYTAGNVMLTGGASTSSWAGSVYLTGGTSGMPGGNGNIEFIWGNTEVLRIANNSGITFTSSYGTASNPQIYGLGYDLFLSANQVPSAFNTFKFSASGVFSAPNDAIINGVSFGRGSGVANNIAIGNGSLSNAPSGSLNIAIGTNTLRTISNSTGNIALGDSAGSNLTLGNYNVFVGGFDGANGFSPLSSNAYSNVVAISDGSGTVVGFTSDASRQNTTWGRSAMQSLVSGTLNSAFGASAYYSATSGSSNTLIGAQSGYWATTGSSNTGVGTYALYGLNDSSNNTAIGYMAGYTKSPNGGNTYVGAQSAMNGTGGSNTGLGYQSLYWVTGNNNTAIGYNAGSQINSGSNNVIIGGFSGYNTGPDIRSLSNNIVLSDGAGVVRQFINSNGFVGINNWAPSVTLDVVGDSKVSATGLFGGKVSINTTSINSSYALYVAGAAGATGGFTTASDMRYKTNITPITSAMSIISKLQGVRYNYNSSAFPGLNFSNARQIGVIAQQVEPFVPELVMTDANGFKSVNYAQFTALLIEGMKELQARQASGVSLVDEWNKSSDDLGRLFFETKGKTIIKGYGATPFQVRNGQDATIATFKANGDLDLGGSISLGGDMPSISFGGHGNMLSSDAPGQIVVSSSKVARASVRLQFAPSGAAANAANRVWGYLIGDESGVGLADQTGKALLLARSDGVGSNVRVNGSLTVGDVGQAVINFTNGHALISGSDGVFQISSEKGIRIFNPNTKQTVMAVSGDGSINTLGSVTASRFVPTEVVSTYQACVGKEGSLARDSENRIVVCTP